MAKVVHFEIPVSDPTMAIDFYTNVFGWEIEKWGDMDYWTIKAGPEGEMGTNGALLPKLTDGVHEEAKEVKDAAHAVNAVVTIGVENIDAAIKRIEENGGKIVLAKNEIPKIGLFAYFTDLDGNILGVIEPNPRMM